jgi:hypothetical protein
MDIEISLDDRFSQALTHRQLGVIAREQQKWELAEQHLLEALRVFVEFKDRPNSGITVGALARIGAARPGLAIRVAGLGGWTVDEVEELFSEVNSSIAPNN